jgi:hypothetical protein
MPHGRRRRGARGCARDGAIAATAAPAARGWPNWRPPPAAWVVASPGPAPWLLTNVHGLAAESPQQRGYLGVHGQLHPELRLADAGDAACVPAARGAVEGWYVRRPEQQRTLARGLAADGRGARRWGARGATLGCAGSGALVQRPGRRAGRQQGVGMHGSSQNSVTAPVVTPPPSRPSNSVQ